MKPAFLYVAIGGLLFLYITEKCTPDPRPVVDPAVIATSDSLKRESVRKDALMAKADTQIAALERLGQESARRARNAERSTVIAKRSADSAKRQLAEATSLADSLPAALGVIEEQEGVIAGQDTVIAFQRARIVSDSGRILLIQSSLLIATEDRDDWRTQSDRWQQESERIGEMYRRTQRFPNKRDAFVGGVLVGAALIIGIARAG